MAAPALPAGYSQAEMDAIFADLFAKAEADRLQFLQQHTPPALQKYLNYYVANSPVTVNLSADVIATGVIKGTPGNTVRLLVVDPGTANNLNINDATTIGGSNVGNRKVNLAFSDMVAGQVIEIPNVMAAGITVSSCPTGGHYTLVYN